LRLADLRARRRAMEDLYAALQAVRNVHSALVSTLRIRSVLRFVVQALCISRVFSLSLRSCLVFNPYVPKLELESPLSKLIIGYSNFQSLFVLLKKM